MFWPAIEKRCGAPAQDLSPDNPVWGKVAHYTSVALTNIIFTLSPERIILGGSVPKGGQLGRDKFMAMVCAETTKALNGYLKVPALLEHMDEYIVPPGLGDNAGVCGAIVLAMRAERGA
ncbi:MAG TPA: ROK family protein [Thermoflexales bacterium]|nr:ROK family protein [Thermoflexales bacterium]